MAEQTQLNQTQTRKVGIREFRKNFANYVDRAEQPVAITRYGGTVGYFIPARPRRSDEEKVALKEAVARLHDILYDSGVSSEEVFEQLRTLQSESRSRLEKRAVTEEAENTDPAQAQTGA